jgi:hypothetical protein
VIAIITLLVAMLAPVLNRARDLARNVLCMSNLKQIGTANYGFASQRDGRFPGQAVSRGIQTYPVWCDFLNREYLYCNRF